MKTSPGLRVVLSGMVLCLWAPVPQVLGAPFTEATVSGGALFSSYPPNDVYPPPPPSSDPHHVSDGVFGDSASGLEFASSRASADAAFRTNHVSVDLGGVRNMGYLDDNAVTQHITASYALQVLPQAADIIGHSIATALSGNSLISVNNTQTGSLQFVYGVPYEIASVLTLSAGYGSSDGTSRSTWADVITFQGGTFGSTGVAQFNLSLTGSLSSEKSFEPSCGGIPGPCAVSDGSSDLTALLRSISIPGNSKIDAASGTQYSVNVPEPSSFLLLLFLACSFAGLVGWRSRKRAT